MMFFKKQNKLRIKSIGFNWMRILMVFLLMMQIGIVCGQNNVNNSTTSNKIHPRILNSELKREALENSLAKVEWKREFVERKKESVEKYIQLCEKDPNWLVSRLQMNWKTKHSNVYLKGGNFSHSDGEAPVPTVRYSGTRDWATDYVKPKLEDVEPYFDDERGYFLKNKNTGKKEWVHPSKMGHAIEGINRNILSIVEDAAFLYWLTGEEKYAKFAEPVFLTYMDGMHYRNPPKVLDESSQKDISGLATFEVIHEQAVIHLALSYDYLYTYFVQKKVDLSNSISVFQKWGDQIIKYGIPDNNWNLFQARFLTYIALVLEGDENYENGKGQQYYLKHTFDVSTPRQIAIKDALMVYDQETGIWPESPSYSMHVNTTLLEIMALLDNVTNANELANFPIIEKAALACFQYLFPSGNNVGFGDSGHGTIPFENFELLIANYKKYKNTKKEQLITSLLQLNIENGSYKRKAKDLFQLNFYVDELSSIAEEVETSALMTPTFYASNVSMFVQRMGKADKAIMVSTVGSYGNHAHTNGISMELFANNYVHAPDMGRGRSYWSPDFKEYYAKMPAHNTVVVDGKSNYSNMRSFHPYSMDHHYPKSGELNPGFKEVSFCKVSFVEPATNADQQRLTAIINTPSGKGYVLDLFRSKTEEDTQKHEYFYHNLGHSFQLYNHADKQLKLRKTNELTSKDGQLKAYDYLTDKKEITLDGDLKAVFKIEEDGKPDNLMKVWIKGNENQSVFSVKSPKSNAISKGSGTAPKSLMGKKMPTLILRRNEEAWTNPFVLLFNPYFENGDNPIEDVDFSEMQKNPSCQKIKVSHSNGITNDQIVVSKSENDVVSNDEFYQKGLFSIVRVTEEKEIPDFIFASGVYQLKYKEWEILAVNTAATVSIENTNEGLMVQNDNPVVLKVPITTDFKPAIIRLFDETGKYIDRKGNVNRHNTNQIEFRLAKPYKKALIISE